MKFRKNLWKRISCLILSCFLLFSNLSNDVQRVHASAIAISVGTYALLSDFLFSLGVTALSLNTLKEMCTSISNYCTEKNLDISSSTDGRSTVSYRPDGVAVGGASKSFSFTANDVKATTDLLSGVTAVTTGMAVSAGVTNVLRGYARERLNISSVDGTAPTSFTYMTADEYFNSLPTYPRSFTSSDGCYSYSASGPFWLSYDSSSYLYMVYCKVPITFTYTDHESGQVLTSDPSSFMLRPNGFYIILSRNICTSTGLGIPLRDYFVKFSSLWISFPPNFNYDSRNFGFKHDYVSSATLDTPWAGTPVVWNGITNIDKTLSNQRSANTDSARDAYLNSTITIDDSAIKESYNTLTYILQTLAVFFGATAVSTSNLDSFLVDFYNTYSQGSAVEKYAQADDILPEFTVINGSGGNSNKNFKVLNVLVNAFLAYLIKNALVPATTPNPLPDTKIENITVIKALDPLPDPTVSPTDPNPDVNPKPDVNLSGVLDWLGKIYTSLGSIPTNIITSIKEIPASLQIQIEKVKEWIQVIPSTFASSEFGQWVKSIPGVLTDIKTAIQNLPQNLIDIKTSILGLPDLFFGKIRIFFTVDKVQVASASKGVETAFHNKFSALKQIVDIFNKKDYVFSDALPIIKMKTPDIFKFAVATEEIVIMDLTPFKDIFVWCRLLLTAMLWVAFGKWILDQFDVDFHIG